MPRYHEIAESLRTSIAAGRYPRGTSLPSERELAQEFDVAAGTVRQALGELVGDGVLASRRGARRTVIGLPKRTGTFEEFRSFAQWAWSNGRTPSGEVVCARWCPSSPLDQEKLRVEPGSQVYQVLRLRRLDERPVMVERTHYTATLGQHVQHCPDDCASVTSWLAGEAGVLFSRAEHQFSACAAGTEDARLLGTRRGAPLLTHRRTSFDGKGTPLEWSEDRYIAGALTVMVDNSSSSNVLRWG